MSIHRFPYRHLRSLLLLPAALALPACAFPKVLGDAPLTGSTESTGSGGSDSDGTGAPTSEPTTEGPPLVCDNPAFTCTQPLDCEQWRCGAIDSAFDASGCLRPSCADTPCADDEICYRSEGVLDCSVDVVGCADAGDACACELGETCIGRFCIPADEGPPAECAAIQEEAACLAAGCSVWEEALSFWTTIPVEGSEQCVVDEVAPRCLWFPSDTVGGDASPGTFYEKSSGRAVEFAIGWIDPPHGWGRCGDPDSPPSCGCAGVCPDLQAEVASFLENDAPCADVSDCVLADGLCFTGDTCGNVGVHKDSVAAWSGWMSELESYGCCDGANACGASLACEDQRCVAVFP